MAPLRDGKQAIEFFERWFDTDIPFGTGRSRKNRIVVRNARFSVPATLAITDQEWFGKFACADDGLGELVEALGGDVSMYPWYVVLRNSESRVGILDPQSEPDKKKAYPGLWVDLRGSFYKTQLREFIEDLVIHDVPAPTVVTGRDMDGTLDYFANGRMWWRTEWDNPPVLVAGTHATQAAWGIHIQQHAIRSGLCNGLPVNGWPTLSESLYPMPGTGGVSVLYTGEQVPWRTIELATDRRLDDLKTQREHFSALNTVDPNVLWDHVLVPQGWRSRGMGTGMHEQWWSAPGSTGLMTAMTDGVTLRLYLPDWLSGLKEASDAGVVLNKWTVACILGWDGDVAAFLDHWAATGYLY